MLGSDTFYFFVYLGGYVLSISRDKCANSTFYTFTAKTRALTKREAEVNHVPACLRRILIHWTILELTVCSKQP